MTDRRHRYDYRVRPNSAPDKVIRMVGTGQRVLELGPGPGSITRHLKAHGCRVTALELDTEAIEIVSEFCEQVYPCNLNDPQWPTVLGDARSFPVIVAADVFEHLYDPWTAVKQSVPLLAPDGCLIVSLPHVAHNAVLACLLNEDFAYQDWGLLDSTHIRFWGLKNMQRLFADAGLKIVEAEFVVLAPEQTEFAHFWRNLPAASRAALNRNRFGNVYQVVIRATHLTATGHGIQLEDLPVAKPSADMSGDTSLLRSLLRRLGSRLNPKLQTIIVRLLRRIHLWP